MEQCEGECGGCFGYNEERLCILREGHPDTGKGCLCHRCWKVWATDSELEEVEGLGLDEGGSGADVDDSLPYHLREDRSDISGDSASSAMSTLRAWRHLL